MPKFKPMFDIGDWVTVLAVAKSFKVDIGQCMIEKKVVTYKANPSMVGRVVGLKRVFLGTVKADIYAECNYLDTIGSVILYQIKQGYLNIPILAFEKDLEPVEPLKKFPLLATGLLWSDEARKQMSEYSKCFSRDAKGRFV